VGHVDDILRVARPWGFDLHDSPRETPIAARRATNDSSVPIDPWRSQNHVSLREHDADWHEPNDAVWTEILHWATNPNT
jgi:hypothetical protein